MQISQSIIVSLWLLLVLLGYLVALIGALKPITLQIIGTPKYLHLLLRTGHSNTLVLQHKLQLMEEELFQLIAK